MYFNEELIPSLEKELEKSSKMLIKVFPFDVTEYVCREIKDLPEFRCCVVSIDDKGFKPTDIHEGGSVLRIFRMNFPDIDSSDAPHLMKYAATPEDLSGLKSFIDEIKDECNFLIVHCAAGVSRSPAVASVIEEYLGLPDTIWSSGNYQPNRHVYTLALKEFGITKTEEEIDKNYDILERNRENIEEE